MKKLICLVLIIALSAATLTGCRRGRGTDAGADAGTDASGGGPGYNITDASAPIGQDGEATERPIETLPPDEIAQEKYEQEKRAASIGDARLAAEAALEGGEAAPASADSSAAAPGFDADAASAGGEDDIALGTYNEADQAAQQQGSGPALVDINSYQFSTVMNDSVDFTFYYPSHWQNVPGIYTICYREPAENGKFPARIAITRKRLVHTADDAALMDQLVSYMKSISKQYDKATFQTSTPNREETFMGKPAFSNTYLAYWGEVEVKGFVIGTTIGRTLYVLHFCAAYDDYIALQNVMQYMVKSVRAKETENQ